ncbi:MAG TPA: ATP-binding protein [Burkholderiaceae bacterium]|mgnify:CR=1 FL=1|nr:ATP-binding protein [Burkholderiaceae bacterium]
MKIALLGAESTGKSALGHRLTHYFQAQGQTVAHIHEVLREWCDLHQRTPKQAEQFGIATEQQQRVASALLCDHLIADTTPLMVAVYSDFIFNDSSLYDMAIAHQRSYDFTLLMGLDMPWVADGLQRDGAHVREPVDALIRHALTTANIPYHVVYGSGDARLLSALRCLGVQASAANDNLLEAGPAQLVNWQCERCSDPNCEHRLFTRLMHTK